MKPSPAQLAANTLGYETAWEHYRRFDAGEIPETPFPPNPFPKDVDRDSEWSMWWMGWQSASTRAAIEAAEGLRPDGRYLTTLTESRA